MKQTIVFIGILVAAFVVTLLLLGTDMKDLWAAVSTDSPPAPPPISSEDQAAQRRQRDIMRSMASEQDSAIAVKSKDGPDASATVGLITGVISPDDGSNPSGAQVTIQPSAGRLRWIDGGHFEITDVPPGYYIVGATLAGFAPQRPVDLHVEAGKQYSVDIPFEKGVYFRGRVVDDVYQRGIEGASVDFNGLARVRSGPNGSFEVTAAVSQKGLELITLSHDDFDRHTYVRHPFPEPNNLVLAMSRGPANISGRLVFADGAEMPQEFRVRVWRVPSTDFEELRRERVFRDTRSFEIKGVFGGPMLLEVDFPGTARASRRVAFDLGRDTTKDFELFFDRAASIDGVFVGRGGNIARIPLVLLDGTNHVCGQVQTDDKGNFHFHSVAAGEYHVRIDSGNPVLHTDAFVVPELGTVNIVVDGDLGRIKK